MQPEPEQVTQILDAVGAGDAQAAEKLLPLVYDELRRLAAAKMAYIGPGQTLQPTALVYEAWPNGIPLRPNSSSFVSLWDCRTTRRPNCWESRREAPSEPEPVPEPGSIKRLPKSSEAKNIL